MENKPIKCVIQKAVYRNRATNNLNGNFDAILICLFKTATQVMPPLQLIGSALVFFNYLQANLRIHGKIRNSTLILSLATLSSSKHSLGRDGGELVGGGRAHLDQIRWQLQDKDWYMELFQVGKFKIIQHFDQISWHIQNIQWCAIEFLHLLHKPYVNEVTLTEHNLY